MIVYLYTYQKRENSWLRRLSFVISRRVRGNASINSFAEKSQQFQIVRSLPRCVPSFQGYVALFAIEKDLLSTQFS